MLRAEWRSATEFPLLTNVALLLLGAVMLEFTRTGVGEYHHYVHGFSETVLTQILVYLGAIVLLELCPANNWTLRIILLVAFAARLIAVIAPPFLSTDIYRYVWDGLVQGAGINPFRYIPADSHLAFLRDAHIYPNINRRDYAHTIYPPGSQMIFWAVTRISSTVTAMKLAMVGFEAATCYVLIRCLKLLRLRPERILLYAWSPVCLWEIASSGHADAAALTFISLALLARLTNRDKLAGGWLGAAALVKLYPNRASARVLARPPSACSMGNARGYRRRLLDLSKERRVGARLSTDLRSGRRYGERHAILPASVHRTQSARNYTDVSLPRDMHGYYWRPVLVGLPARRDAEGVRRIRVGLGHSANPFLLAALSLVFSLASSLSHNTALAPGVLPGTRSNVSADDEVGGAGRADVPVELLLIWRIFRAFGQ